MLELVGRPKSRIFGWVFDGVKVKGFWMIFFGWHGFRRLQTNLQPGGFNWELELCMKSLDPWMVLNDLPTCCDEMLYAKCVQSMIELKVMSKLRT